MHAAPAQPQPRGCRHRDDEMARSRWVLVRDLLIFQVKLVLDGMKDIALSPLSFAAAAFDILLPGSRPGHRFYAVMAVGEKFDRWLNLFGAASAARADEDGLFGASRAGSPTMLGGLEAFVRGGDLPRGHESGRARSRT
jgi:hypothetical protein